jgi:hypothetical protein
MRKGRQLTTRQIAFSWFFFLATVFFLFRLAIPGWVRDDTENIAMIGGGNAIYPTSWQPGLTREYFSKVFTDALAGHNRQFSQIQKLSLTGFVVAYPHLKFIVFLYNACLVALAGLATFLLFEKIFKDRKYALLSSCLATFSCVSVICSSVMLSFPQCMVVMFSSFIMYWYHCYFEARSPKRKQIYLLAIGLALVVGGHYREFVGVSAVVLLADQAFSKRRSWQMIVTLAIGFYLVVKPEIVLTPFLSILDITPESKKNIFTLGLLGNVVGSLRDITTMPVQRWLPYRIDGMMYAFGVFFAVFPLLNLFVVALLLRRGYLSWRQSRKFTKEAALALFFLLFPALLLFRSFEVAYCSLSFALIFFCASRNRFLFFWIAAFLLPFTFVYTIPVHLIYPLAAATAIYSLAVRELIVDAPFGKWSKRIPVFSIYVCYVVAVSAVTFGSGLFVNRVIQQAYTQAGRALRSLVKPTDTVVFNGPTGSDIYFASENAYIPYQFPIKGRDFATLETLLKTSRGGTYFMHFNQKISRLGTYRGEQFDWLFFHWVDVRPVGTLATIDINFPVVDPLYMLYLSGRYLAYIGPPDSIGDYRMGPGKYPFTLNLNLQFNLFKVVGGPHFRDFSQPPVTVETYRDFSIYAQGGVYFPVPNSELQDHKVVRFSNYHALNAYTLEEARKKIDRWLDNELPLDSFSGINM